MHADLEAADTRVTACESEHVPESPIMDITDNRAVNEPIQTVRKRIQSRVAQFESMNEAARSI